MCYLVPAKGIRQNAQGKSIRNVENLRGLVKIKNSVGKSDFL
jgi:hypothetical protein